MMRVNTIFPEKERSLIRKSTTQREELIPLVIEPQTVCCALTQTVIPGVVTAKEGTFPLRSVIVPRDMNLEGSRYVTDWGVKTTVDTLISSQAAADELR